ncbi:MAG: 2-oxo acid dehydrogenase subunit E2, partial [Spirochaetales bacterium]|nr:2-oxo acid dehydrogenase subunit E2 [Spirochaetales bacterium]
LETGKAAFDVEAEEAGTVLARVGSEGDEIPVKAVVCVIGKPGESFSLPAGEEDAPEREAAQPPARGTAGIKISPRARRLALREGVEIRGLAGTGPGGRIIEDDIKAALARRRGAGAEESAVSGDFSVKSILGEYAEAANSRIKKSPGAAQYTMFSSFDAEEILSYRERFNSSAGGEEGLGLTALLAFAVSRVLPGFPSLNAFYGDEKTFFFSHVSLGITVDASPGLCVPVIKNADTKSLAAISREIKILAEKCRAGKINSDELSGAAFTVSDMTGRGAWFFTAPLNPRQSAILGAGSLEWKRKKTLSGMADYRAMGLSLTARREAVEEGAASDFLLALREGLENLSFLLVR